MTADQERRVLEAALIDMNCQAMHPFAAQGVRETVQKMLAALGREDLARAWYDLYSA